MIDTCEMIFQLLENSKLQGNLSKFKNKSRTFQKGPQRLGNLLMSEPIDNMSCFLEDPRTDKEVDEHVQRSCSVCKFCKFSWKILMPFKVNILQESSRNFYKLPKINAKSPKISGNIFVLL